MRLLIADWSGARYRRVFALLALSILAGCKDNPVSPRNLSYTCRAGTVTVNPGSRTIPVAPNGFAAVGKRIVSIDTCEPYRFLGLSHPSLAYWPHGDRLGVESTAAADFAGIRSWKANTVRLELAQYFWVKTSRFYDPQYADRVDRAVRAARAAGLHVILALQFTDRGDPNYPGDIYGTDMHQPMPDVNHSIPFWKEVAERYKGDGGVLFELFGEPYPMNDEGFSNWDMWLNGGMHRADRVYDELRGPFQAVGMQQLYDAVRSTGAHNLVLVSGTTWGYHLSGVPTHRLKGHNIVYTSHPWDWPDKQPSTWQKDWGFLAATDPVMITEFGGYDCTERYPRALLERADQLGLSWVAWAWRAPGPDESKEQDSKTDPICAFPMLLTDWDGTPSRVGQAIKDRLASY